jgi:cytochrome c
MKRMLLSLTLLGLSASCLAMTAQLPHDAQTLGCDNCHAMNHKLLGPGWLQIAQRYRATRNDPATLDMLTKKVSRGGAGSWGTVPMIACDPAGLRQDKIRGLVTWVLSLPGRPLQFQATR